VIVETASGGGRERQTGKERSKEPCEKIKKENSGGGHSKKEEKIAPITETK